MKDEAAKKKKFHGQELQGKCRVITKREGVGGERKGHKGSGGRQRTAEPKAKSAEERN